MTTNVGIVGTGWVASQHIAALKKIEGVCIRAICGRNTTRAAELTAGTGAAVYDHWQKMLSAEQLDAVFILLPPHLHGDLEVACAQSVKGVLIEKPIGVDVETAERIDAAFRHAGTIVSVGYMSRYRESVRKTRDLFANTSDPVALVNGWWIGEMPGPLWWRDLAQSGGQFVEQCTHLVDAARYIVGEIAEVSAFSTRGFVRDVPGYSVEDAMVVNVRFASGAIGNFTTACHPQGFGSVGLKVSSRTTQCSLTGWSLDLQVEQHKAETIQHKSQEDIFVVQNQAFLRAVIEQDASLIRSSYGDAMKTLRVTLAANDAAISGKTIRV